MFFLCTAEHYSIINPILLHKFKGYNKENGKPDESLGRKATGPVKWQPAASQRNLSLGDLLRISRCCFAECIAEQHLFSFSNFFPKEERHAKLNILGKAVERL